MRVTPVPVQGVFDFRLGIQKSSGGPRTPGVHLSTLYNLMLKELYPERYERFAGQESALEVFGEIGFAVEHIVERGLKARHAERPEEFQTEEGIYFSPDLLIYEDDLVRVGEIKATWMSSREVPRVGDPHGFGSFPPKFDKYLIQVRGYCRALGTPHALLIVFFVNGRYDCQNKADDLKPEIHAWQLTFTQQELDDNWRMLMNYGIQKGLIDASGRAVSAERVQAILDRLAGHPNRNGDISGKVRDPGVARPSTSRPSSRAQRPATSGSVRREGSAPRARRSRLR